MHKIIIGFSNPRSSFVPFSWAIKVFQGWWGASHAYIAYESPLGVPMVYQASGRKNNFMALGRFYGENSVAYEFPLVLSSHEYRVMLRKFEENAGAPYGRLQILGIALKPLLGRNIFRDADQSFICTEVAAKVLQLRGQVELYGELEDLTPKQLFDISSRGK